MFYLERSVDPAAFPGGEAIIRFKFRGAPQEDWWLVVEADKTDVCMTDPGRDIDVYITTTFLTMHDVWMGDRSYREAMLAEDRTSSSASSSPMRQGPKPSPRSALRSISMDGFLKAVVKTGTADRRTRPALRPVPRWL